MSIEMIVNFLNDNANKKVSTINDELVEMISKLKVTRGSETGKTFYKDDEGNVVAIYCYYHKKWELVDHIAYGKKASTSHGLNTMCKQGTSNWTKQHRQASKAKEDLLNAIANGEVAPEDIADKQREIEEAKVMIVPHSDQEHSFDTLNDALEA